MADIAGDQDTQSEIDGTRDESFQQETDTSDKQSTSFDTSSSTILHITEPAVKSHSSLNSTSRVSITLPPLPTDSTYSLSDLSFQKKESDGIDYSDEYALAHEESVIEAMRPLHHGNTMSEVSLNQVETIENINENYDEAYNNERPYIQRENTNTVHERSDDTEQYPDEEDTALLDASHPLMKRIQDAIHHQLTTHINKLELEVREKEEMARKEIKRREEVGVELYTLQQQLARQQAMLEETEDNFAIIRGLREEGDRTLKHTVAEYKREQEKYQLHSKNLEQHKLELEKISRSLRQVDLYNEELRSRILVVKRSTLKAEDDIMKQEIEKKRQDYFIDHLTEQLRKLQERRAVYDNQLQAQQRETKAAVETLQDAATEMEAIQFEKRQLLNQWKSSLMGLQRRDDVLLQLEKAIEKSNETIASMEREIGGFRRALRQAQTEGEQLTMILGKLENEIDYIKRQIATINDQQEKLKETYTVYMKSLGHAEKDLGQLQQERQAVQQETNAVKKAWTQNAAAIQKLEQEIADRLQVQLSLEKGTQSFNRDGTKLRASIHEKESNIANIQNELSSIKLESLNVAERIKAMKAQATTLDDEVTEKNNLIGKYEQEIRRRNDELGKRASDMDLLNKKYSQVTGGNEEEHMGPLEATIHNLQKLVHTKEQECIQLQQFWLRAQNELVAMTKTSLEITDETQSLKMKQTVLSRKKLVVNNTFESEEKEICEHNRNIKQLQNDMIKINILLSKQTNIHGKLEEANLELEQEFRFKLKQAELKSIQMEHVLDGLKNEKSQALTGLIEAERQMMLWEKKIQLAKETQAALDPNVGATEIREMGLEIHRMKLRYSSMLKLQEKMIGEMEKSVYRRESISSRGQAKGKGSVQISLQKAIAELTKKIKQTIQDVEDCHQDIQMLNRSKDTMQRQIDEANESSHMLVEREGQLKNQIEEESATKIVLSSETLIQQRQYRRYQDLRDGKYTFVGQNEMARAVEGTKAIEKLGKIKRMISNIHQDGMVEAKPLVSKLDDFLTKQLETFQ
ncbi:hypothetical protein BDV3_003240 [Batrachochytrium dendrobatidis]|nr:Coiled-coil domain-containing protein 40 [Batrachochytrium dendrobatidis]OAJ45315.1 hypothetical protein BDEG_28465 [Batrachochytrium dendrobatidis JEL423]